MALLTRVSHTLNSLRLLSGQLVGDELELRKIGIDPVSLQQPPVEGPLPDFDMLANRGAWDLLIEDPRSVYFAANLTYPFAPDGQRTILLLCSLRASCTELRASVRLCLRELLILLGLLHRDAPLPAPREALRLVQVPSPQSSPPAAAPHTHITLPLPPHRPSCTSCATYNCMPPVSIAW